MSLIVKTESLDVEVITKPHAERMICTTAYSMQLSKKELKEFKEVQRIANHFNIDTDKIIITSTMGEEERNQGYTNKYSFR